MTRINVIIVLTVGNYKNIPMKTKKQYLSKQIKIDRLTPIQYSGILRAMDNYKNAAIDEFKKGDVLNVIKKPITGYNI